MAGRRSALIVATSEYQDPKLKRLRTPEVDAERLARVLRDQAIGDFEVDVLTNPKEGELRRRLPEFFTEAGPEDVLLLHFACHGVKDDDGTFYFAAADTQTENLIGTALEGGLVARLLDRCRSRRVVLLLDCCYSGAFPRGMAVRGDDSIHVQERFAGRGRVVIAAADTMEYAWEQGGPVTELSSGAPSVFASALVEGLETGQADRDGDGEITVDELYAYVFERVREQTPKQTPNMTATGVQGELVIAHSVLRPVDPLPSELRQAMESPFAGVREGTVAELVRLLGSGNQALAQAARQALQTLTEDDSKRVATAASAALTAPVRTGQSNRNEASTAAERVPGARQPQRVHSDADALGDDHSSTLLEASRSGVSQKGTDPGGYALTAPPAGAGRPRHAATRPRGGDQSSEGVAHVSGRYGAAGVDRDAGSDTSTLLAVLGSVGLNAVLAIPTTIIHFSLEPYAYENAQSEYSTALFLILLRICAGLFFGLISQYVTGKLLARSNTILEFSLCLLGSITFTTSALILPGPLYGASAFMFGPTEVNPMVVTLLTLFPNLAGSWLIGRLR